MPSLHQHWDCALKSLGLKQGQSDLFVDARQFRMLLLRECELTCGCFIFASCCGFESKLVVCCRYFCVCHTQRQRSQKYGQPHFHVRIDYSASLTHPS